MQMCVSKSLLLLNKTQPKMCYKHNWLVHRISIKEISRLKNRLYTLYLVFQEVRYLGRLYCSNSNFLYTNFHTTIEQKTFVELM
jgi:hypothetical protein